LEAFIDSSLSMKTPPAEMTSGCWPGNPQWPLPAEKITVMPLATAAAIAAASARSAAERGPNCLLDPHEQVMMCGLSATAALNAPIELAKFIFTGNSVTSGATEKMLADSPVPWPLSSAAGLAAPGPRVTGLTR
jgi:hypothetical protein